MEPLCPPMTVTGVSLGEASTILAKKRAARTTSSVVIPNRRLALKTPAFSRIAATMGTVKLTDGNDKDVCSWGNSGNGCCEVADNGCVGIEKSEDDLMLDKKRESLH